MPRRTHVKLQIMLLVASLGSILVVGYLSWSKARETLTERIFDQLTSVRASKAYQVEFKQAFAQLNQFLIDSKTGNIRSR